jgi:hypothetical protein
MGERCPGVARSRVPLQLQQWKRSIKPVVRQPRKGLSLLKALRELDSLSADVPLVGPVLFGCDNKTALSLCQDQKEGQRVIKHIDIIHHFARDHVAIGELKFVYCKSEDNVSDCLTKGLPRVLFKKGLDGMGMCDIL